jgi:hypothetical protein
MAPIQFQCLLRNYKKVPTQKATPLLFSLSASLPFCFFPLPPICAIHHKVQPATLALAKRQKDNFGTQRIFDSQQIKSFFWSSHTFLGGEKGGSICCGTNPINVPSSSLFLVD